MVELKEKLISSNWLVYLLCCSDNTLYCWITNNLIRRIDHHNNNKGAKYTRGRGPVTVIKTWPFQTKSEALKFEYYVKQLSKKEKLKLMYCRSCEINKENYMDIGRHIIINNDIYCPACQRCTNSIYHGPTDDTSESSFECAKCNNYILYTLFSDIIKDEIYFDDESWLVRDDIGTHYFSCDNLLIFQINYCIDFNINLDRLKKLAIIS